MTIKQIDTVRFIKRYILSLSIFLIIDFIWLAFVAKGFYNNQIGFLLADEVNWLAATVFYLLFIFGLNIFVINTAISKKTFSTAFFLGGLFGLITYSTYDLTNLATIENWPVIVSVVDIIWGTFIGAITSLITFFITIKMPEKNLN